MITIQQHSPAIGTHYAVARKGSTVWNGATWEDATTATATEMAITATDAGGGWYSSSVPDDADRVELRLRVGEDPDSGDPVLWTQSLEERAAIATAVAAKIGEAGSYLRRLFQAKFNRKTVNTATGEHVLYEDDGTTVAFERQENISGSTSELEAAVSP